MSRFRVPDGWRLQAYNFCIDKSVLSYRESGAASHYGGRRFAWNWGLDLIQSQLHARNSYRLLALRQGATVPEANEWARVMVPVPWSQPALRKIWNEEKVRVCAVVPDEEISHMLEALAIRGGATVEEAQAWANGTGTGTWWQENSKEVYSSAFETLAVAFKNYFDSRSGKRKGPKVGWPKPKKKSRARDSVSFTTGVIKVVDRHHIQLPTIGALRVHEPTDKLRLKIGRADARILRATMSDRGVQTYVSFSCLVKIDDAVEKPQGGANGIDVGISVLATCSDGRIVENPKVFNKHAANLRRYQRKLDRQHRAGSPKCFDESGCHIKGACHWSRVNRSKKSCEVQARIKKTHAQVANTRKDAVHKLTYQAATTHAVNVVEDLNVSAMLRKGQGKRHFNKAAQDAVLSKCRRQLSYKHIWYGSQLWVASRWYPSSKRCSKCATVKAKLSRGERTYNCDVCGLVIDRDLNAAKNLAQLAELAGILVLAQLFTGKPVDWSKMPVRPYGYETDQHIITRSSRESARAGGRKSDGAEVRPAAITPSGVVGARIVNREVVDATKNIVAA